MYRLNLILDMEDSNKSMAERLESLATDAPKDLDQLKSMPMEDKRMRENNGIGPENGTLDNDIKGMETKPGGGVIVDFERILKDFPKYQDNNGKFKILNQNKYHLEIVDNSVHLFENGELIGVMFSGDKLEMDNITAKVINYPVKEDSKELTFGQKAVKATFDPSGDPRVVKAKQLIADAIDLLEEVHQEKTDNGAASSTWFRNVFRTEAFNQLVNASSSLVKYLTWQD